MFNNSSKILFILTLIMGTLITISSNSWLGAWMGLEINLLSFIPLMSDNNSNLMSTEASLKYFLVQALASTILLFAVILMMINLNLLNLEFSYLKSIILSSLLLKSGTAPFHFWFPNVMEGLSWMNALILMTWQKIAPMILISYILIKPMIIMSIILSVIIGSLGGLNQTSIRKLMAFSSINHLGWMLTAMLSSDTLWIIYLMIYSFLSFNLIFLFNIFNIFHINQLLTVFFKNSSLKFFLFMNLLSLGGLPPFLGFFPKWMIIQITVFNSQLLMITLMTFMALITLFFYLRLCYTTFMFNYTETTWNYKINTNDFLLKIYFILSFISTFGLPMISLLFIML